MVVKVVGKVDNQEVVFSLNQNTGRWETIVPRDLDGTYVIDLWAYDDAGNCSYCATVLFTVDVDSLHISMEFLKYRLHPEHGGFCMENISTKLHIEGVESDYCFTSTTLKYILERGHECELL